VRARCVVGHARWIVCIRVLKYKVGGGSSVCIIERPDAISKAGVGVVGVGMCVRGGGQVRCHRVGAVNGW